VYKCGNINQKRRRPMLKYKIDILEELKQKGFTTYKLRKDKIIGEAQIQKIREGELASKETLNTICKLLNCQPGDILEYVETDL
jgi:putative transcriptional regulator